MKTAVLLIITILHTLITITTIAHTTTTTDIIIAGMTDVTITTTANLGVRKTTMRTPHARSITTHIAGHIITTATTDAGTTTTTIIATVRSIIMMITTITTQTIGAVAPIMRTKDITTAGTTAVITMMTAT